MVFDMKDYMATLRRMLAIKPTRLYPGHGAFIDDGVDVLVLGRAGSVCREVALVVAGELDWQCRSVVRGDMTCDDALRSSITGLLWGV